MISVIIPVFNSANRLERCLRSVAEQHFDDWECLLIDDGSTDGSSLICDTWALRDNHYKVIHQSNQGVSFSRNVGIDLSQGDWIYFLDSDDYCMSVPYPMPDLDAELIIGEYQSNDSIVRSRRHKDSKIDNYALSYLREELRCCMGSYLVRKSFLDNHSIRFTVGCRYGEDMEFNFYMFLFATDILFSDSCFSTYQQSPSSATRRLTTDRFDVFYGRLRQIDAARNCNNQEALTFLQNYSLPQAAIGTSSSLLREGMAVHELVAFIKSDERLVSVLKSASLLEKQSRNLWFPAWLLSHCPVAYKWLIKAQDAFYSARARVGKMKRKILWTA